MKKNYQTTMKLPKVLIGDLCGVYETQNISQAVFQGLADFLLLPSAEQILDGFALHQLYDIEARRDCRKVSIRIPKSMRSILESLSTGTDICITAAQMLARTLYLPLEKADFTQSRKKLINIMGSKYDKRMRDAISQIFETAGRRWKLSVETCAGALGIHSNFEVASREIINDDDTEKINLYRAVKEHPRDLVIEAAALDTSPDTFQRLKKQDFSASAKKVNVEDAASFLFLNQTTYRNEGSTFLTGMNSARWKKRLEAIYPMHQRLKHTEICEMDLFKIIGKYRKENSVIFIVDPPYLDTNVYISRNIRQEAEHGADFGWAEHKKLAKLLRMVKENNHNDFIYFCRITATRRKNKQNEIISSDEELESSDKHMKGRIDDLYFGHGFYFLDVELDKGTIERIITTFPFEDALPYGASNESEVVGNA